jgi:hypothetical protein
MSSNPLPDTSNYRKRRTLKRLRCTSGWRRSCGQDPRPPRGPPPHRVALGLGRGLTLVHALAEAEGHPADLVKHIIDNAVDAADGTGTLRLATRGASSVERRGGTITINSRRVRSSCGSTSPCGRPGQS